MVLGVGQGNIVAVLADLLHALLVNDSPHEAVIAGLAVLGAQLGSTGDAGDDLRLPAIEGVQDSLHHVGRITEALEEEREDILEQGSQGVEALLEGELHVEESDVGAAGRVGGELEEGFLLGDLLALGDVDLVQGLDELVTRLAGCAAGHA